MKIRTLFAVILGLLLVSGLSWSQESTPPELFQVQSTPRTTEPSATRGPRRSSSGSEMVTKIFELKHFRAGDLEDLICNIFGIGSGRVQSPRRDLLILQATKEQMVDIEALVRELDVEQPESEESWEIENLVYRIYMFEIPSGDQEMKPFSMSLDTTEQVPPQQLLDAVAEKDVQISEFRQIDKGSRSDVLIQGRAASYESLRRMVEKLPESNIDELKWGDDDAETFTDKIAAAQYTQLSEQMQKHIRKFLGNDIRTVGYWFGNSSVPGEIEAPIGPWMFQLQLEQESDRTLELRINVEAPEERYHFERQLGREESNTILSNTIQAKVGKPIIVGYNRQSYGTRRMGAMVIVPEVDKIEPEGN